MLMYNLKKFQQKKTPVKQFVLWGRLLEEEIFIDNESLPIVVNKDGSLQTVFKYRGPDLDSATEAELGALTERLNNTLVRVGSDWIIYAEAQRKQSNKYTTTQHWPDEISKLIDEERQTYFGNDAHFESVYYFTIYWLPPVDNIEKMKNIMIEGKKQKVAHYSDHLKFFGDEIAKIFVLLKEILPEVNGLTKKECLTYLHSTVSTKDHSVNVPSNTMLLDSFLYDSPLVGGLEPMLGDYHLRVIIPLKFIGVSEFGMFDTLNRLGFEYRWVTRFICMDKLEGLSEVNGFYRKWKGRQRSVMSYIKESLTGNDNSPLDENAIMKTEELAAAKLCIETDRFRYGLYSSMIIVLDKDKEVVEKKARLVEDILDNMGLEGMTETLNSVDAWFASLPGNVYGQVRKPIISTGNLVHMLPLSDIWAGESYNKHLDGPAHVYTETSGSTPFRLNLHVGDVGHTMVVGPTGAGKSVLLCLLMAQFRKYKDSRVFAFDKGGSIRALTAGVGGKFYDLANEDKQLLSFQPLAHIDDDSERMWASEWIFEWLRNEGIDVVPETKRSIEVALEQMVKTDISLRHISSLSQYIQDIKLKDALHPLTVDGSFGKMFDSKQDNFSASSWQVFEMERLMDTPAIIGPTLSYLFHKVDQYLDGRPTLLVLDECWALLDNTVFSGKIKQWLKELRKKNASVIFATQSLADVTNSSIVDAIKDSCYTKIFLPNDQALQDSTRKVYQSFDLNSTEIKLISNGTPKKDYYYKSRKGSRLFDLAMGPVALGYCAAASKADQRMVRQILTEHGKENFNIHWKKYKGIDK